VLVAILALLWTNATSPSPASAQDDPEVARAHSSRGTRLYEVGNYREALDEFKAAHLAKGDPAFLYNIAQCHRQLGDNELAVVMYKRYLNAFPQAPNRVDVERRMHDLEASLAGKRKEGAPPRAPSAAPALQRSTASSPMPAPTPPVPLVAPRPDGDVAAGPAMGSPAGSSLRYLRWVGVGITLGLAGGAIATGLSASSKYADLRDSCGNTPAGCARSQIDTVKSRALWTNLLWGAAGAAAIATGIAFYLTPSQASVQVAWRY
jgi:tetratricopeptide (TPR) repeat protein